MANDLKIQNGKPVDENLRPILVGGKVSALEIAQSGDGAKVTGDLNVGGSISYSSGGKLYLKGEGSDSYIATDNAGDIDIFVDGTRLLTMIESNIGNVITVRNAGLAIDQGYKLELAGFGGSTSIDVESNSRLRFIVELKEMFILDSLTNTVIMAADNWVAGTVSGATITEFSAENSSYAGMILGYTAIGADATTASESISNSFVVTDATHKVTFVAPPSGNVEIYVSIYAEQVSNARWLQLGLSDNATYHSIDVPHEHYAAKGDETDREQLHHEWVITGLTSGTEYEYWLGAKAQSASAYTLYWGGDATGEYQPFVMKAIALPATIYTG